MMQLQSTRISCSIHNKGKKEHLEVNFMFLPTTLFSSKENAITECVVEVHDVIVASLNRHHAIWLNAQKLSALEPIAAAFYKRLFYHFSNTYTARKARSTLKFEKDYDAICREWLGGLKSMKYRSLIQQQIGVHLDAVAATGLISRYEIATRTKGPGFKIVFHPGAGFFEDYAEFYLRAPGKLATGVPAPRDALDPKPLQLVAYFHELLGHRHNTFADKEKAQAAELLARFTEHEVRDLIEYAVRKIKGANFNPDFFGAVMSHKPTWEVGRSEREELAVRQSVAASCPICKGQGWVLGTGSDGEEVARKCGHGQAVGRGTPPSTH
jgi:hypothetical protein